MRALLDDDIVVGLLSGTGGGGVDVPLALQSLPMDRLRYLDGAIVDAVTVTSWHVDRHGRRHVTAAPDRQPVVCTFSDVLVRDGDVWRVRSPSEAVAVKIKSECQRRIFAVASTNTQMNLTAARAAGRLSASDEAVYAAGLDWIDAMRGRCAELIASVSSDYLLDQSWPAPPDGLADLVSQF